MAKRSFDMSEVGEGGNLTTMKFPGFYKATIDSVKEFEGQNGKDDTLYVYMTVNSEQEGLITVRDRKSLGLKSLPYLKTFCLCLVPQKWSDKDLSSKNWSPDFEKDLPGKVVHFQYTPPEFGPDGKPLDGSFANFSYMRKEKWEAARKMAAQLRKEAEEAARAEQGDTGNGDGKGSSGGDYGFLNEEAGAE